MIRHRILIADKNELVRKGLLAVLEKESIFEVVGEACNGEEAIQKAKEQMPDLILMAQFQPDRFHLISDDFRMMTYQATTD